MLCLVISISSLVVFPRLLSLGFHWLGDETLWLVRSHNFIQSKQDGDLKEIPSHPGVTTMWLGGTSLWLRYKGNLAGATNLATKPFFSPDTLAATRMAVALTITIAILSAWYLLFRLLGWWTSAFAIVFVSVDPFYLALSRILHTDALAASFALLAVLSLLVYVEQSQRYAYVILSGICFGLACLSKITALVLVLYLPLLLGFYKIFNAKRYENKPNISIFHLCLTWLGAAFLTSICLWPSLPAETRYGSRCNGCRILWRDGTASLPTSLYFLFSDLFSFCLESPTGAVSIFKFRLGKGFGNPST